MATLIRLLSSNPEKSVVRAAAQPGGSLIGFNIARWVHALTANAGTSELGVASATSGLLLRNFN